VDYKVSGIPYPRFSLRTLTVPDTNYWCQRAKAMPDSHMDWKLEYSKPATTILDEPLTNADMYTIM